MLDPEDWSAFRTAGHRALDDMFDFLERIRERPAWTEMPADVRARFSSDLPQSPSRFEDVYEEFAQTIFPYTSGNVHPRFFGWVQGTGTPGGAMADLFAATMNSNVGGRNHGAVYVERQVIGWFARLFGFPEGASGLMTIGTSAANAIAVLVARTKALGSAARIDGVRKGGAGALVAYTSASAHGCVRKAFENAGLGASALRVLPVESDHRLSPALVVEAIAADRAAGLHPFMLIATAGTVDIGAIDPLEALAALAQDEGLWFHVDGAFGAAAYLAPALRPLLRGIERADSIAFDFHKWLHVPYDAGCVLVRDGEAHRATFASEGPYLTRMERGLAAGTPWFTDYGPDLSRGFRALKVWFTVKEHGAERLGESIANNCRQARYLQYLIEREPSFEMLAPVALNVVCFRYAPYGRDDQLNAINDDLVIRLQESGVAVTSSTTLDGIRAIRVCIVNHRTKDEDLDLLVETLRALAHGSGA